MSKLFVTDPCLVVPDEQWGNFCAAMWKEDNTFSFPFPTNNGATVLQVEQTANGDGGCRVRGKVFGTDTGTIAIIEVPDDFVPEHKSGAFAKNMEEATELMFEVCQTL